MCDPENLRIFVPNNAIFQRHLLYAYHNSPLGMHRGRDTTYTCLSHDFYWRNMSKHARNWIRRCPDCIKVKTLNQAHGPMQIRIFEHPFHTLGVDYVGELPQSPSGNKWILTVVCPYSNFLRTIPVPDKTATTAACALLDHVLFQVGFTSVLQSDRGGEFLNAIMHRLTSMLSIRQVYTSGFCPRLNGTTERVHRFLNSAIGIFCKKTQEHWEEFLQPAVYAHNSAPISGTSDITPFFLVFGCHAPSPETISLDLPLYPLPADHYAHNLVSHMQQAHEQFCNIKADLRRRQRELYDISSRDLHVPDGKIVYMRKESAPSKRGQKTSFLRNFDFPFIVTGHPHGKQDLLNLRHATSGNDWLHPVNVEKIVVVPEGNPSEIAPQDLVEPQNSLEKETEVAPMHSIAPNPDLAEVAYRIGKYLDTLPSKSIVASQACKFIYESYPQSREIVNRHGRLRGLVKSCPFIQLEGALHGGIYILSLNTDMFRRLRQ